MDISNPIVQEHIKQAGATHYSRSMAGTAVRLYRPAPVDPNQYGMQVILCNQDGTPHLGAPWILWGELMMPS